MLDERVPLHKLQSLDIYNDHFPMRMPGIWELKNWTDFVEVTSFSFGQFPEPLAFSLRAWDKLRSRKGDFDLVHDNQCLGYGLLGIQRDFPLLATIHHPITVDRRLEMEHARRPLQAPHAAALVLVHQHAVPGRPAACSGWSPCPRTASPTSTATTACPRSGCTSSPSASIPTCSSRIPGVERIPGRLITTASADVTMKGLSFLLEAVAKLRTERDITLTVIGKQEGGRQVGRDHRHASASTTASSSSPACPTSASTRCTPSPSWPSCPRSTRASRCPAIEAMSCGIPLVATTGGALPEVVGNDNETALLVPPGDSEALAAKIAMALDDKALRDRIGAAGRQRVIDNWSWRHTAQRTVEQYRALLAEDPRTRAEWG